MIKILKESTIQTDDRDGLIRKIKHDLKYVDEKSIASALDYIDKHGIDKAYTHFKNAYGKMSSDYEKFYKNLGHGNGPIHNSEIRANDQYCMRLDRAQDKYAVAEYIKDGKHLEDTSNQVEWEDLNAAERHAAESAAVDYIRGEYESIEDSTSDACERYREISKDPENEHSWPAVYGKEIDYEKVLSFARIDAERRLRGMRGRR